MKTAYTVVIMLALLFVSACTQKVNDPADAEAIKTLGEGYDNAVNSRDLDWVRTNFYAEDAVTLPPNQQMLSGVEAIVARDQAIFDRYNPTQISTPAEEVFSSGDLAAARGTYAWTGTPVASGLSEASEKGKWIGTFKRQSDGSWRCTRLIWNSDQPAAGATADGADEQALLQIERDWLNAALNKDRAALDKIIASDFIGHGEEGVKNKTQLLSLLMSRSLKIESAEIGDMQPMVFGDTAAVYGTTTSKESISGKDTSGQYCWTDIFEKRDGLWQCVGSYSKKVK